MPSCVTIPATPAVVGHSDYIEEVNVTGWGTGANTIAVRANDCYVSWMVNSQCIGAVVGFCPPDRNPAHYDEITHGIYATSNNGVNVAQVVERGALKGELVQFNDGDLFYIRRVHGRVEYSIDGTRIYTSLVQSRGSIRAGASLFLSGDEII